MGMYTHLCLNAYLENPPQEVVDTLRALTESRSTLNDLPDHPFFRSERARFALQSGGAYHPASTRPTFGPAWEHSPNNRDYRLTVNTSIKNYDSEWEKFLDWIAPYCQEADGYYRYEEDETVTPVRIFDGKIIQGPGAGGDHG